jgi:hypothetical protein
LPPGNSAEIQRLLRRQRIWSWLLVAGIAVSLFGWGYGPVSKALAPGRRILERSPIYAEPPYAPPAYIKTVIIQREGMGYLIGFALADSFRRTVVASGTALVFLNDMYYGYDRWDEGLILADTQAVSPTQFRRIVNPELATESLSVCVLKRLSFDNRSSTNRLHRESPGCFVLLWFTSTDGDTLHYFTKIAWPWD